MNTTSSTRKPQSQLNFEAFGYGLVSVNQKRYPWDTALDANLFAVPASTCINMIHSEQLNEAKRIKESFNKGRKKVAAVSYRSPMTEYNPPPTSTKVSTREKNAYAWLLAS